MGVFSFLSSNYKPKDFLGKTAKQIVDDMKSDKLSEDIKSHEEYSALPEETKGAIDMLLDLKKGKIEVYDKCYAKRARPASTRPVGARPASMVRPVGARPASMTRPVGARPASMTRPASVRPMINGKPGPVVHPGPFQERPQAGGRRKTIRRKSIRKKRKGMRKSIRKRK
jgi:hypothetical protein